MTPRLSVDSLADYNVERFYVTEDADVAHLCYIGDVFMLCDKYRDEPYIPDKRYLWGTGSQDEYDHARTLRVCPECLNIIR